MKYLITGVVAAGKSTVAARLIKDGFTVYEGDDTPGFSRWEVKNGRPVENAPKLKNAKWYDSHDWNWNKQKLKELLTSNETVFICGISSNQSKFYNFFDRIFLLQIDEKSLIERLKNRHQSSMERHHEERQGVLGWHKLFEDDTIKHGAIVIDATLSPEKVVDEILSHVETDPR